MMSLSGVIRAILSGSVTNVLRNQEMSLSKD